MPQNAEIAAAQASRPLQQVRDEAAAAAPPLDFHAARAVPGPVHLIAEVKKASPSKGVIREDFDPESIARTYAAHGATCLSVLTDEPYFQGSLAYLRAIRAAVDVPLLRKDFILDPYQLFEARAAGADAVLLIAECLDDDALGLLLAETERLGMSALVELYEPENLMRVLDAGAKIVGVNNRNLHTFETDLSHAIDLRRHVPRDRVFVAESGIHTQGHVMLLEAAGVNAMLVGESLMRQDDVGAAVDALLGNP
ncbi:MAG: indole-3-glycerol phosphate synthase TrpC [Pirellulales bacterium]